MEHPNNLISSFSADFIPDDNNNDNNNNDDDHNDAHDHSTPLSSSSSSFHINHNHVILRGCVLSSTEWIIGFVVNTGHDVKIMQTGAKDRQKTSSLDRSATKQIILVFCLLLLMCFVVATAQAIWNDSHSIKNHWYLDWAALDPGPNWVIQFFYTLILHAENIPIPLYVSMQVLQLYDSYHMMMMMKSMIKWFHVLVTIIIIIIISINMIIIIIITIIISIIIIIIITLITIIIISIITIIIFIIIIIIIVPIIITITTVIITTTTIIIIITIIITSLSSSSTQVVRFVQAYFMHRDLTMYDSVTNQRARVRTMPLNEELGQISYMFCDKTVS